MPADSGYEFFDHTADIGVRVWAPTLADLVIPATEALYAAIGQVRTCGATDDRTIEIRGDEAALLLHDYLSEILRLFDGQRCRVKVLSVPEFSDHRLAVQVSETCVDFFRSALEREIKAVTYHELVVRVMPGGFEARYIVDI